MKKVQDPQKEIEQLLLEKEQLWNEIQEIKSSKGYQLLDKIYRSKIYQNLHNRKENKKKHQERRKLIKEYKSYEKEFHMSAKEIYEDVKKCENLYGASFEDYQMFGFYELPDEKRETFITKAWWKEMLAKVNDMKYDPIFVEKDLFYQNFKEFLGRDFLIQKGLTKKKFTKFVQGKNKIVYKPCGLSQGRGVKIYDLSKENINNIYQEIMNQKDGVIEDYIAQHSSMKKFSPAVNTIRITTLYWNHQIHIIGAILRMGYSSDEIDNFSTGGIIVEINPKTGKLSSYGIDKDRNLYDFHPKTKVQFENFKIPYWDQVLNLIDQCVKVIPQIRYVGWDIAITEDGPILVEGNSWAGWHNYQLVKGILNKEGMKSEFEKILNEDIDNNTL